MRFLRVLLLLLILPSAVQAADIDKPISAKVWMERMSHSLLALNYRGEFSYQQGENDDQRCFRILHAVFNGEIYEQLEFINNNTSKDIAFHDSRPLCQYRDKQLTRLNWHRPHPTQDISDQYEAQRDTLEQYYDFNVVGDNHIANHEVVEIAIEPKDTHRYGYLLSLDKKTGLPLSAVTRCSLGKIMERFQFFVLETDVDIPLEAFQDSHNSGAVMSTNKGLYLLTPIHPWQVKWLPQGFAEIVIDHNKNNDMLVFSDGLAVFSIFIEKPTNNDYSEASLQEGATTAYSIALSLDGELHRVTVVGDIPYDTAKQVAKSVDWVNS